MINGWDRSPGRTLGHGLQRGQKFSSNNWTGALEIGSRPEIRTELNLINRNSQFITMTRKRLTMTDILVSGRGRSEITHKLSIKQPLKLKYCQVRTLTKWQRESCSRMQSSVQNQHTRRSASHWPNEALCCLVIGQELSHRTVYANFNSVGGDSTLSRRKNESWTLTP